MGKRYPVGVSTLPPCPLQLCPPHCSLWPGQGGTRDCCIQRPAFFTAATVTKYHRQCTSVVLPDLLQFVKTENYENPARSCLAERRQRHTSTSSLCPRLVFTSDYHHPPRSYLTFRLFKHHPVYHCLFLCLPFKTGCLFTTKGEG